MRYDLLHIPGPPIGGCGEVCISPDLADGHARGDRLSVVCQNCGRYGEHEVLGVLTGLEND